MTNPLPSHRRHCRHHHEQPGSLSQVLQISERFQDLPFDLADASVAEAAARLGIHLVLTLDSDFDVYRNQAGQALVNVLRAQG